MNRSTFIRHLIFSTRTRESPADVEGAGAVSAARTLTTRYIRFEADVNSFGGLDGQTEFGPTYRFEYSAREAYGGSITGWGPNDPLNATWWHLVTEGPYVYPPSCPLYF